MESDPDYHERAYWGTSSMADAGLIVVSGLPGVGKTSIARALAGRVGAVHLRLDTIEQILLSS
jgi:2-phosphoglycerate kinase